MRYLILLLLTTRLAAQTTPLSGIINHYAAVTAFDTCSGAVMISDTTGFRPGGVVLFLQPQGAQIAAGNNGSYGQVQNMQAAGRYERASVDSVSATAIFLKNRLVYTYNPAAAVQVITIPQYANAIVVDTVRARPWNGQVGGVLALEVAGTLTLNAPLWADGAGFRGGAPYFVSSNNCNFAFPQTFYYYAPGTWRSSYKGEGVARPISDKELGRGPQANGGGGGNDHNAGGGGGGHLSDGGRGGDNNVPDPLGCSGHYPGLGGYSVLNTIDRWLFGGGGGAGHANNGLTTAGANGGGSILVQALQINGSNPTISASGLSAKTADGDGGGGGGAGGTIWLQTTTAVDSLVVRANGGNGGNTYNVNANRCAGPGGGGSGGRILTNLTTIAPPNGGQPGVITSSINSCNGSSAGAQAGETGFVQPLSTLPQGLFAFALPIITTAPQSISVCAGATALFVVGANAGPWTYQWQVLDGGQWLDVPVDSAYAGVQNDSLRILSVASALDSLRYRALVKFGSCAPAISGEALLSVDAAPTATFVSTINGISVDFINQSALATGYIWNFGDGSFSQSANPQHTYAVEGTYLVTLQAIGSCDTAMTTQLLSLLLAPTANISVPDSTLGCLSATVAFQNLSSANAAGYQWSFPGGSPAASTAAQPSVTYASSGTYAAQLIVSNPAGQDTLVQTFQVQVASLPSADFDYALTPGGVVYFTNQSQQGTAFSWDFGDGYPLVFGANAFHQYTQSGTYVVTLAVNNPCGAAILQQNVVVTVEGVGTAAEQHLGQVRLYPNPVQDRLIIDCSATLAQLLEVQVFDATGRLVLTQKEGLQPVTEISLAGWPGGYYTVSLRFANGRVVRGVVHATKH